MSTEVSAYERGIQPYSDIGIIESTFPDGTTARGTASIVGRNDIITATHVVYSPDNGGWADSYQFYFAADYNDLTNTMEDYGYTYTPTKWTSYGWPNQSFTDSDNQTATQSESENDIALIGVSEPIGDTLGWLGLDSGYNNSDFLAKAVGYPEGATGMMQEDTYVSKNSSYNLYESNHDVMGPGSSGGPLLKGDYVIGIKSTGMWWADIGGVYDYLLNEMYANDSLLTQSVQALSGSLTQEQILNVCIATFDAAPGAANLATLEEWTAAHPDATTADLAAALGELPEFAAQFDGMDTATKAATMASHFGLTAGTTGGDAAIAYFTQEIDNGTSDAAMLGAANDFLLDSDAATLTSFGLTDAAAVLANKTTVATYYSVTAAQSGATIADLQAIVADVDATATTVTSAESAVDAAAAISLTAGIDTFTANIPIDANSQDSAIEITGLIDFSNDTIAPHAITLV